MRADPLRQLLLGEIAGGETEKRRHALSVGRDKLDTVAVQENFRDDQASALVAVQKWMIA